MNTYVYMNTYVHTLTSYKLRYKWNCPFDPDVKHWANTRGYFYDLSEITNRARIPRKWLLSERWNSTCLVAQGPVASHTCVTSSPPSRRRPLRRSCIQIRNGIRARLPGFHTQFSEISSFELPLDTSIESANRWTSKHRTLPSPPFLFERRFTPARVFRDRTTRVGGSTVLHQDFYRILFFFFLFFFCLVGEISRDRKRTRWKARSERVLKG